jgi:hypothetical protein
MNPIQMLTLASYVLFAIIAMECIAVSFITRIHPHRRRHAAAIAATAAMPGGITKSFSMFTRWLHAGRQSRKEPAVSPRPGEPASPESGGTMANGSPDWRTDAAAGAFPLRRMSAPGGAVVGVETVDMEAAGETSVDDEEMLSPIVEGSEHGALSGRRSGRAGPLGEASEGEGDESKRWSSGGGGGVLRNSTLAKGMSTVTAATRRITSDSVAQRVQKVKTRMTRDEAYALLLAAKVID